MVENWILHRRISVTKEKSPLLHTNTNRIMQKEMNSQYRSIKPEPCGPIYKSSSTSKVDTTTNDKSIFRPRPYFPRVVKSSFNAYNNGKPSGKTPKKVRFGDIKLREYPIMLGDNPACSNGPPVSIQKFIGVNALVCICSLLLPYRSKTNGKSSFFS